MKISTTCRCATDLENSWVGESTIQSLQFIYISPYLLERVVTLALWWVKISTTCRCSFLQSAEWPSGRVWESRSIVRAFCIAGRPETHLTHPGFRSNRKFPLFDLPRPSKWCVWTWRGASPSSSPSPASSSSGFSFPHLWKLLRPDLPYSAGTTWTTQTLLVRHSNLHWPTRGTPTGYTEEKSSNKCLVCQC